jgi:DNA-binding LacI/PurR family transcriptional regulator
VLIATVIESPNMNLPNEAEPAAPGDAPSGDNRSPRKQGDLHKTITMAQIAKAAGVSQGAISSLLNDRDYGIRVSEKTRERVFKVCREMGYIPNDLRAVVRMYPEYGDCCVLLPQAGGLADPVATRIAAAAMSAAVEPVGTITIATYDETVDYAAVTDALPHPLRSGVCSKFLCVGASSGMLLQALRQRGSPAISLGYDAASPGVLSIVPDYAQASKLAIEHLYSLGHRQIGIVSGPFGATDPVLLDLNRGVRLACDELGLPLDAKTIVYGDLSEKTGHNAVEELFSRQPQPTAIFCMSDAAAVGVLQAAQSRGISVPGQLSVVGCADDLRAALVQPALTTVHLPVEEMTTLAMHEIERLVREPLPEEPKKMLLPVRLVTRASTAAPIPG